MIKQITAKLTPQDYLTEIGLVIISLFGFYLIIAWSSYSPFDNTWAVSSSQPETINKAGALGAWLIGLFFTLFGHIGNLVPFALLGLPIYFLKNKGFKHFSWIKLIWRWLGSVLLCCGLCSLATLVLSDTVSYLAGGVLGGSLVMWLYPILGKTGLILTALLATIIGFVLCSGKALILLVMNFYHWVTMNERDSTYHQPCDETDELNQPASPLEEIIIQQSQFHTNAQDEEQKASNAKEPSFININGLSALTDDTKQAEEQAQPLNAPITHSINVTHSATVEKGGSENGFFDPNKMEGFSDYGVIEDQALPNVTLIQGEQEIAKQSQPSIIPMELSVSHLGNKTDDFTSAEYFSAEFSPTEQEPKLTVSIPEHSLERHFEAENSVEQDNEMDELTRQFAEQEAQRLAEMQQRAKEINAEDALAHIFAEQNPTQSTASQPTESQPTYKPYGDFLIHPALQKQVKKAEKPTTPLPSLDLLDKREVEEQNITREEILETSQRIEQQLRNFNVKASVKDVLVGPVVTRYELELQPGVKASKVTNIDTDLARALMFRSIRVAEVIPGKPYIGIETPNLHRQMVPLRDVLDSPAFRESKSLLSMALGKDISGNPVIVDLAKMPHLLVAGSTGSGKSVGVNTMILSLLFRVKPEEVKFIMIDPKVVELSIYNDIPHLLTEVVTDMKKAANALRWCVDEMERRYQLLSALRVRNIEGYNEKIDEYNAMGMPIPNPIWRPGDTMDAMPPALEKLSYIVVIVDEFADLMMVAGKQIEELIARLAQKARAIGIHLILATQRPSVDVITGLIKANIPSRIAFTVASKIDSRTILDQGGAETLLGRGDMLYSGQGSSDLIRVHGAFMSDDEVARVADDWRARGKPDYIDGILDSADEEEGEVARSGDDGDLDDLFDEVMNFVIETGTTSASSIQRRFRVGFNRAARIMDQLEEQGIVSPLQNGKREILARRSDY
ncbi:DNA translocase FtsK 4TM domain-containing protein [Avibacterium sp. 21-586]|uniref:DNA translocase FtsK n=1 Tax=Avibacterium sp. 21-586 TaxID=2911534 RepID=UPI002245BF99|nr:DNA translocase FtsK [Avibacterium sp. 21-586]MCW9709346.1 DNA translocase FtsK 4TM domain-containing protein [Avibacterium sp. 21-586]